MISYDFFIFGPSFFSFFFLKISLLEMLIAFGNEHLKMIPLSDLLFPWILDPWVTFKGVLMAVDMHDTLPQL